jgi:CubicO group peptidase (beta-lactamase class C family)
LLHVDVSRGDKQLGILIKRKNRRYLRQHVNLAVLLAVLMQACGSLAVSPESVPPGAAVHPASDQLDNALVTKVEASLARTMKDDQVPGLAIGIIKNGQVVYSKGFGVAKAGTDLPVTPKTVFQLGSDSKMMVGIAIMQLREQGKIDLDAPVTTYLPYFRLADERYPQLTIRFLLSHRSGLPYCVMSDDCDRSPDYQLPQYDDGALDRYVRSASSVRLNNEPGKIMQYSDLGFEILGDVIAKISGQSFESYVRQHIFLPLGMQHTSFSLQDIPADTLAQPHTLDPDLRVNAYFPYSRQHAPSSHLFSNVDDMNRFALAQLNQGQLGGMRILPPAVYQTMWGPEIDTAIESPWEKQLGLGWFIGDHAGHHLVGHGGGDIGFACGFIMAPEDGLAVVVMTNRAISAEDISYQVMAWLLEAEDGR